MIAKGQRYMSLAEPELGLGIVIEVEDKNIQLSFPVSRQLRRYGLRTAPLKRILFEKGDEISSNQGLHFSVTHIEEDDQGLRTYYGHESHEKILEIDLSDSVNFHSPEEKILNMTSDSFTRFELRQSCLNLKMKLQSDPYRGLIGPRISLIDHQLYLAEKICNRPLPRALLADEVGLGKTIEAGLILHRLVLTERVRRVLIIVPNTLCYQWFVEMFRKYNLSFSVVNEQVELEKGANPFEDSELVIASFNLLAYSEIAAKMAKEANWDLLIVDEAHKYSDPEKPHYPLLEALSQKTPGLLLLTATPEMLGLEGHFLRLKLLDPQRFSSYQEFLKGYEHSKKMTEVAKNLLNKKEEQERLQELVDHHSTGRIFFKNTRKAMENIYNFFPRRILHSYPLQIESKRKIPYTNQEDDDLLNSSSYKLRLLWLAQFLENRRHQKILLICRSKKKIMKLEQDLKRLASGHKIALFHSELTLLARDRQAAYFADPEGANLLLCTEIGSEGRNFEFAHDLVLFDLPLNPDLLEQRIGRLDRIGQKEDVLIHLPYLENSWEEFLLNWYGQGLNAFEKAAPHAMNAYRQFQEELHFAFENVEDFWGEKFENLLCRTKEFHRASLKQEEEGKDTLIEINSFNKEKAQTIVQTIKEKSDDPELPLFLDRVFHLFGIDVEEICKDTIFIRPSDNMFVPHFPCLSAEGMSLTFSRTKALEREDYVFMTWDHPMVMGIIDLILAEDFGNATLQTRKAAKAGSSTFVECFFLLHIVSSHELQATRYFPPQKIRILLSKDGENFSNKWSKEDLDPRLEDAPESLMKAAAQIPKSKLKSLLHLAEKEADKTAQQLVIEATAQMQKSLEQEIERLDALKAKANNISESEIYLLKDQKERLTECLKRAQLRLDSLRFIV